MSRRLIGYLLLALAPLLLLALAVGGVLLARQGGVAPYRVPAGERNLVVAAPARLAEGEYLARLGNCVTCHSTRGGVPFAGGRAFRTEYGTLFSTNLTPDPASGLGDWSAAEFRHAMRNGVSRHGVLYPAFPYANFALLTDADLDALFAYLASLPPSTNPTPPNRLEFPASWRPALIGWRMLHYRPADPHLGAGQSAQWQRGRYLVDGLGHCAMCHGTRGDMGSLPAQGYLAGGTIPGLGWYAPPLDQRQLARWTESGLAAYLRHGTSPQGDAYGPMAEVVYTSLRHLREDDALAIAVFLKSVPARARATASAWTGPHDAAGEALYERHCADCHGSDGRGKPLRYPPLVDAVAVTAPDPVNALRMILYGAMPPTTAGNPRPHTMPPFVQSLDSAEIAAVTNYIRTRWGGQPSRLGAADVEAHHGIVLD
jgi:mono/diheme cytochrome c family protein